jgi:hypothetical protein
MPCSELCAWLLLLLLLLMLLLADLKGTRP